MPRRILKKRAAQVLLVTVAAAFMGCSAFLESWTSSGPSMWPALYEQRFLTTLTPFTSLRRGDIVVFRLPHEDVTAVKRVVGLPGDTVEVRDGRVFIDGRALGAERDVACPAGPEWLGPELVCWVESAGDHRWLAARGTDGPAADLSNVGPVVVPPGAYYVVGDMRTQSNDSRNPSIGTVLWSRVEGRLVWGEAEPP